MTHDKQISGTLVKNQTQAVAHALKGEGHDASEDGTGRGTPIVPVGIAGGEIAHALRANPSHSGDKGDGGMNCTLAIHENQRGELTTSATSGALKTNGGKPGQGYPCAMQGMAVRRLTPRECERLQGFPDDYTLIQHRGKPAADGPRYKALGNSMAVPVMRWIGERMNFVDSIK